MLPFPFLTLLTLLLGPGACELQGAYYQSINFELIWLKNEPATKITRFSQNFATSLHSTDTQRLLLPFRFFILSLLCELCVVLQLDCLLVRHWDLVGAAS